MSDGNEIIQRQVAMHRRDWDRVKAIGRAAEFPAKRSHVFPSIIGKGCDKAEIELGIVEVGE